MNILECAIIKKILGSGGGGASEEVLAKIADLEARVEALEPSRQLFNIDAIGAEHLGSLPDGTPCVCSYYGNFKLRDVCPNLKIGAKYTISACGTYNPPVADGGYDPKDGPVIIVGDWQADGNFNLWCDDSHVSYESFTLSEELYNSTIVFNYANCEVYYNDWDPPVNTDCDTFYYNIMVNEGDEPLPWEPYEG